MRESTRLSSLLMNFYSCCFVFQIYFFMCSFSARECSRQAVNYFSSSQQSLVLSYSRERRLYYIVNNYRQFKLFIQAIQPSLWVLAGLTHCSAEEFQYISLDSDGVYGYIITTIMMDLQQSVFLNFSRVSRYQQKSRVLDQPHPHFPKFRQQQTANQFELVDFQGKGKLTKQQIVSYLTQKYETINLNFVNDVLQTMRWTDGEVAKQEFCEKWVGRQRQLFHSINQMRALKNRYGTTKSIYEQTKRFKPRLYASIKIIKIYLKSDRPAHEQQDWLNLEIQYEDHEHKLEYLIEQPSYAADQPSFDLLLPVQAKYFFVRYKFTNPRRKQQIWGQCYVNFPIGGGELRKAQLLRGDIKLDNKVKGYCEFLIQFESDMSKIENELKQQRQELYTVDEKVKQRRKEYEYMQFLWGIRHRPPSKIDRIDVTWIITIRVLLAAALGLFSIVVQVLGRCEPMSFILSMLLARNWKYVILGNQKFGLVWIAIAALCLDCIWIALEADEISQINFLKFTWTLVVTYCLIALKILLLLYLLLIQKAFSQDSKASEGRRGEGVA